MRVNDLAGASVTGTQRALESGRTANSASYAGPAPVVSASRGDAHLAELVRVLRALAAESPERNAHIESIARAYAQGNYQVNPETTAECIVLDALGNDARSNR